MEPIKIKTHHLLVRCLLCLVFLIYCFSVMCCSQAYEINKLIQRLGNEDKKVQYNAEKQLIQIGKPAVKPLIAALKNGNPRVREEAVSILGILKDPLALEPLIVALKDENIAVRRQAAHSITVFKDLRALEPLIAALKDENPRVRVNATNSLGYFKNERSIEALIVALKDENHEVRLMAANRLGDNKDPRAIGPLLTALKDGNPRVRYQAVSSLGDFKDPRTIKPLIAALKDVDHRVRDEAASQLFKTEDPNAIRFIRSKVEGGDIDFVYQFYEHFIRKGDPSTEAILIRTLNSFGKIGMAENFLNSGNGTLENAARAWASKNGYTIKSGSYRSTPGWGRGN
jgi:HEAT repeat protein